MLLFSSTWTDLVRAIAVSGCHFTTHMYSQGLGYVMICTVRALVHTWAHVTSPAQQIGADRLALQPLSDDSSLGPGIHCPGSCMLITNGAEFEVVVLIIKRKSLLGLKSSSLSSTVVLWTAMDGKPQPQIRFLSCKISATRYCNAAGRLSKSSSQEESQHQSQNDLLDKTLGATKVQPYTAIQTSAHRSVTVDLGSWYCT